ncbi:MAG: tRNA epoxyqueuosine(34) reductase QueG [Deltaproteobacteria bacterium]|nr:tRNA epoxyqueuosine(34) reductase QueG [Deltaproteobacteria bacterium]
MSPATLTNLLHKKASALGFDLFGVVPVSRSKTIDIYKDWLQKGYAGTMEYLEQHAELKENPRNLLPETLSLIALGCNYNNYNQFQETQDASKARFSRYAWGDDYHEIIHSKLKVLKYYLCNELNAANLTRSFVDSGPVLERELAQRAGIGWFGKHSNLINMEKGSWFFLAEMLVDVELKADLPFTRVDCGTCTKCIEACPTGAIIADRTVDARLCISYLTIEHKDSIPHELRPKMGNHIFGCDICQEVCPWNKDAPISVEPGFKPRAENISANLTELMSLDQAAFSNRFRKSPVKRAKRSGFLRNVAVALGNWAHKDSIPALVIGINDSEPLVRIHSAWALGRINNKLARKKLKSAMLIEKNPNVLREIVIALGE